MKEISKKLTALIKDVKKQYDEAQEAINYHSLGASEGIEYRAFIAAQSYRDGLGRVKDLFDQASSELDNLI